MDRHSNALPCALPDFFIIGAAMLHSAQGTARPDPISFPGQVFAIRKSNAAHGLHFSLRGCNHLFDTDRHTKANH